MKTSETLIVLSAEQKPVLEVKEGGKEREREGKDEEERENYQEST